MESWGFGISHWTRFGCWWFSRKCRKCFLECDRIFKWISQIFREKPRFCLLGWIIARKKLGEKIRIHTILLHYKKLSRRFSVNCSPKENPNETFKYHKIFNNKKNFSNRCKLECFFVNSLSRESFPIKSVYLNFVSLISRGCSVVILK